MVENKEEESLISPFRGVGLIENSSERCLFRKIPMARKQQYHTHSQVVKHGWPWSYGFEVSERSPMLFSFLVGAFRKTCTTVTVTLFS